VPPMVPLIIEDPEPTGPFGAKGVGEPVLVAVAPAVANAVADAVGVRIRRLPLLPERIREGLLAKQEESA
jgi:CO/xanthine dehydrogenase Mo-binding subunit